MRLSAPALIVLGLASPALLLNIPAQGGEGSPVAIRDNADMSGLSSPLRAKRDDDGADSGNNPPTSTSAVAAGATPSPAADPESSTDYTQAMVCCQPLNHNDCDFNLLCEAEEKTCEQQIKHKLAHAKKVNASATSCQKKTGLNDDQQATVKKIREAAAKEKADKKSGKKA